jgi:hypothetical protein
MLPLLLQALFLPGITTGGLLAHKPLLLISGYYTIATIGNSTFDNCIIVPYTINKDSTSVNAVSEREKQCNTFYRSYPYWLARLVWA